MLSFRYSDVLNKEVVYLDASVIKRLHSAALKSNILYYITRQVVPFKKHFKASIEVGPMDDLKGNYESIAYYYLTLS